MLNEKYLLKLEDGTLARIDAVAENRAEFIRGAILKALDGGGIYSGAAPKVVRRKPLVGAHPDDVALMEWMRDRPGATERQMRDGLGWNEMRVGKAVGRLLSGRSLVVLQAGYMALAEGA